MKKKIKAYVGTCPVCGVECVSGLKDTSCWNCGTKFTITTEKQEINWSFDELLRDQTTQNL